MERNCTCTLKLVTHIDNRVSVKACLSHYGYIRSLQHIWISKKKQEELVAKLKQGVSQQRILDKLRDNVGSRFTRDHLIDKKDLTNIKRSNWPAFYPGFRSGPKVREIQFSITSCKVLFTH